MLLALLSAGLLLYIWHWQSGDPDRSRINAERSRRLALVKRGETLPATPDLADLAGRLARNGLAFGAPVFIRIFKREFEFELWIKRDDRYHRLAIYPICRYSGELGPKLAEGDHQSPEGFYTIDRRAMNPHSRWYRAFNLGFPNVLDRAHGRTGSFLMVHGGCSSVGCYAMTNGVIDELWRLVDAALRAGQKTVHVHVFPFRLSEESLRARAGHPASGFWADLKAGYDAFEDTGIPPRVTACMGHYQVERQTEERATAGEVVAQCGKPAAGTDPARDGRNTVQPVSKGKLSAGK